MVPDTFRDPGPEWHKRELKSIQDSIPRGVKLDDAMVYKITRYFCAKHLGRFWPLDFDEAGNTRKNRTSVGPGIKIFYAADETWYYPVFYHSYILSGDDELVEYEIVDPGSDDTNSMTAYSLWTFGSIKVNRGIVDDIASDTSQKQLVTKSLALQTSSAGLRSAGPVITENSERWLIMDCETRSHIMYCFSPFLRNIYCLDQSGPATTFKLPE